jgi:MoxR-like ATPase
METRPTLLTDHHSRNSDSAHEAVSSASSLLNRLRSNIGSVFLGKPEVIEFALVALLAEGHLLIEDIPGIGKTLLAKALARSLDCTFHRIQFTPDLLPSDLIGTSVFHQTRSEFIFQPGPLFAQVILADEINRATPRTQSALLEAMSDGHATVDAVTRSLGAPFLVLATQNPYEFEGTYPLPESQLDRFLLRVRIGYPERQAEKQILTNHRHGEPVERLQAVVRSSDILALQKGVREVRVEDSLSDYILDLIEATRRHAEIHLGGSTRAALALYRAAQGLALLHGRDFVVPDDVKRLVSPVLGHRLITKANRQGAMNDAAEEAIADILDKIAVPA